MVYIEIIYLILYSIICFLVVKNIFKTKVENIHQEISNELEELSHSITSNFEHTKDDIVKQNRQYLLEMNKDISQRIEELSNTVKNKRII